MTGAIKSIGEEGQSAPQTARGAALAAALGQRSLVLVGLMGSGKSAIGRRLAQSLGLEFVDSDTEVERAADMTIPEIFAALRRALFPRRRAPRHGAAPDRRPARDRDRRRRLHERGDARADQARTAFPSGSKPISTCSGGACANAAIARSCIARTPRASSKS